MATAKKDASQPKEEERSGLQLTDLRPAKGSTRIALRVGRGHGSGAGKTCNRGHRGQGQRSGYSRKKGFEGGQMPLFRRVPKLKGFKLVNPRNWLVLRADKLHTFLAKGQDTLTYERLQELRLLNLSKHDGLRIIGNGDVQQKFTVEAHYVTPAAKAKIEAAGGQVALKS